MRKYWNAGQICIIGLGRYGSAIAKQLLSERENNLRLILVDQDEKHLTPFRDEVDMIYVADCAEQKTLEAINVIDFDVVIVATSDNIEIIAALKEMGVNSIIARASSKRHAQVLRQIGVKLIVSPEEEAGKKTAMLVTYPTLTAHSEYFVELQDGFVSTSVIVKNPNIFNKKISELQFRNKYDALITMIKRNGQSYIPEGDFTIEENDLVTFIGLLDNVAIVSEFCATQKKL
ncbi:potassium channel family protein [Mycoplasma struthionis]|uniref:TrkA family potassium uptake protein n=1 Tax=Mycoplasma struthionis TaxID=538220 RepID=A0A3G8LGP0_9MOLU|nr:TrkA family potassium uptake protein [Mycoplasma struthionis]AZG68681.1 TrkA family potassium uptake protein [Mycoplasma struthionis]